MPFVRAIPVVCSAVLLICSASAQQMPATTSPSVNPPVVLGDVQASPAGNSVEIRIPWHGVTPHKMLMKDPDRIVLDFRGAQFGSGNQRVAVNQAGVLQVRISQFQTDPAVARVVIDLSKPLPSRLETVGDAVVLHVGGASSTGSAAAVSKPQAAPPRVQASVAEKPSAAKPTIAKVPTAASTPSSRQNAVVEALAVQPGKGELNFSVKLSQAVTPKLWSEREPDRIVMDFPGTLPGNTSRRITVGDGSVQTIRLSLYQENPPVTRIVFDVASGTRKPQLEANGNELMVKFQTGSSAAPQTATVPKSAPAPKAESNSAPIAAGKPSAMVHRPAVQAASHPPVVARVSAAPHIVPNPPAKEAAPQAAANNMYGPHPPNIRFANGLLSIEANNSVLTDILFEVGSKTGAEIQMPPWSDAGRERVVAKLGPGNPRDVIAALLHGSSFNYVIVESPQGLQQLILTPKVDWPGPQGGDQAAQQGGDQPPTAEAPVEAPPAPEGTPPPPDNPQS
jgi:AMIN domain-containing protein